MNCVEYKGTKFYMTCCGETFAAAENRALAGLLKYFDVLEMLVDCVCAGMARSGEIRNLEIDNEILTKAVSNLESAASEEG